MRRKSAKVLSPTANIVFHVIILGKDKQGMDKEMRSSISLHG